MAGILDRIKNRRNAIYTDIDVSFEPHPVTGDLVLNSDETAVTQALRFLVLTNIGERLYQPLIGGDINRSLFSLVTPAQLLIIKEKVKELVENHEKRVDLIDVDVVAFGGDIRVDVYYTIRNNENTITSSVIIKRDR